MVASLLSNRVVGSSGTWEVLGGHEPGPVNPRNPERRGSGGRGLGHEPHLHVA